MIRYVNLCICVFWVFHLYKCQKLHCSLGLEPLLKEFGVDVVIWAHEHSYERTWPLYDKKVYNGTRGAYVNPGAPVHVITGSAGCRERTDGFIREYYVSHFMVLF